MTVMNKLMPLILEDNTMKDTYKCIKTMGCYDNGEEWLIIKNDKLGYSVYTDDLPIPYCDQCKDDLVKKELLTLAFSLADDQWSETDILG